MAVKPDSMIIEERSFEDVLRDKLARSSKLKFAELTEQLMEFFNLKDKDAEEIRSMVQIRSKMSKRKKAYYTRKILVRIGELGRLSAERMSAELKKDWNRSSYE